MIYVGTSGYSYDDWVGRFYPNDTQKNQMLDHYARHFDCVEINFTYYTMPNARTLRAIADKTPPGFQFAVKAHQDMTHGREGDPATFETFRAALQPMLDAGKLGCVLAQFPNSFHPSSAAEEYLRFLAGHLPDVPLVVEFRHAAWATRETMALLRELGVGFCCVDQPRLKDLVPPVAGATSRVGYVRLHGRNAEKWWRHDEAWERYNYLYGREELEEWVPRVQKIAGTAEVVYVFFNNHYNAQAVQNASLFAAMLEEAGVRQALGAT